MNETIKTMRFRVIVLGIFFCIGGLFVPCLADVYERKLVETFANLKDVPEPFGSQLAAVKAEFDAGKIKTISNLEDSLRKAGNEADQAFMLQLGRRPTAEDVVKNPNVVAIPYLIGLIDADNSYDTVYGIGYFHLLMRGLTDVPYNVFHDGAFWRRWWEKNKSKYPENVQKIPIPDLPKTAYGKTYKPFPEDTETLQGQLRFFQAHAKRVKGTDWYDPIAYQPSLSGVAQSIGQFNDPTAIPYLIAVIDFDKDRTENFGNGRDCMGYIAGYFGMGFGHPPLTDVKYDGSHNGDWWRKWWEENKKNYPESVQKIPIPSIDEEWNVPDLTKEVAAWRQEKEETAFRQKESEIRDREEKRWKEISESPDSDVAG